MPVVGGAGQLPPTRPGRPGFGQVPGPEGPMWPPGTVAPEVELKAAIKVVDGAVAPDGDGIDWSGTADSEGCRDVCITGDIPKANGIYIEDSNYEITNAKLCLAGDCVNDFGGNGAAVQATGCSEVELRDSRLRWLGGAFHRCMLGRYIPGGGWM